MNTIKSLTVSSLAVLISFSAIAPASAFDIGGLFNSVKRITDEAKNDTACTVDRNSSLCLKNADGSMKTDSQKHKDILSVMDNHNQAGHQKVICAVDNASKSCHNKNINNTSDNSTLSSSYVTIVESEYLSYDVEVNSNNNSVMIIDYDGALTYETI
jgi:hypothetical protein